MANLSFAFLKGQTVILLLGVVPPDRANSAQEVVLELALYSRDLLVCCTLPPVADLVWVFHGDDRAGCLGDPHSDLDLCLLEALLHYSFISERLQFLAHQRLRVPFHEIT
jgi:hypothetical protein